VCFGRRRSHPRFATLVFLHLSVGTLHRRGKGDDDAEEVFGFSGRRILAEEGEQRCQVRLERSRRRSQSVDGRNGVEDETLRSGSDQSTDIALRGAPPCSQ
jgi:hypothetical protein